jgi:hypothetical protein
MVVSVQVGVARKARRAVAFEIIAWPQEEEYVAQRSGGFGRNMYLASSDW